MPWWKKFIVWHNNLAKAYASTTPVARLIRQMEQRDAAFREHLEKLKGHQ